ncbi:MAG: NUDIX domain-containing protein [archaeon]
MEFLDVVDDDDRVIGKASEKDIYAKRLMHRIVHILIFNDKKEMALQFRSKHKPFCPHHWSTSVGGRVQSNESYEKAAMREYEEELCRKGKLKFAFKDLYVAPDGLRKFLVTFTTAFDGSFKINPEEVERVEFFSLKKIQKMVNHRDKFHPELLFLLEKHYGIII